MIYIKANHMSTFSVHLQLSATMKLILLLLLVAFAYADKLDRTYLPPPNANTAGGRPGDLIAPGSSTRPFGQGLPINSPKSNNDVFGENIKNAESSFGVGFGSTGFGGKPRPGSTDDTNTQSGGQGFNKVGFTGQSTGSPFSQTQQSNGQRFVEAETMPEREQASAERNAQILKYTNENNGDSYSYSYETSNGISAEETGDATNGVNAQGGYSYTGDNGIAYSVTYTADENGYQPQGEHLPTPHPIPEEILKSIEENAKAAASGTQEGAYRPEEYETNESSQKYNTGTNTNYQPQQFSQSLQSFPSYQEQNDKKGFSSTDTNKPFQQNLISEYGKQQGKSPDFSSDSKLTIGTQRGQTEKLSAGLGQESFGNIQGQSQQFSPQTFRNQEGQNNAIVQGQRRPNQRENGYNYDNPQKTIQDSNKFVQPGRFSAFGNQKTQPQTFSGFETFKSKSSGDQPDSSSSSNFIQPQQSSNEDKTPFGNQLGLSKKLSQIGEDQEGNGYNYKKPIQGTNQFSGIVNPSSLSKLSPIQNNGFSGQSAQPNQGSVRPFEKQPNQATPFSQGQRSQGHTQNGYNHNQPQQPTPGFNQFSGIQNQQGQLQRYNPGVESKDKELTKQPAGQPSGSYNQSGRPVPSSFGSFSSQEPDQKSSGNIYNYNNPTKSAQGSNQFSRPGKEQEQPENFKPEFEKSNQLSSLSYQGNQGGRPFNQPQTTTGFGQSRNMDKISTPRYQFNGRLNQPATETLGSISQQKPSNQNAQGQRGQQQDENGYYYNRPQNNFNTPASQDSFRLPQSANQNQPGFSARPSNGPSAVTGNGQQQRPAQNKPSYGQVGPVSSNTGVSSSQGPSEASQSQNNFGSPVQTTQYRPGKFVSSGSPYQFQSNLATPSGFQPQESMTQYRPGSSTYGSQASSQNTPSQTSQGYQYNKPGQTSSQTQRPGFNPIGDQIFNDSPANNNGSPARPEFEGPRQPPSFSAEEGYKY